MKIYISGKITGTDDYEKRFFEAAKKLKVIFPDAEIVNPVKLCDSLNPNTSAWFNYMDKCIVALRDCTHISMIGKWKDSKGALVEYYLAKELKLHFV